MATGTCWAKRTMATMAGPPRRFVVTSFLLAVFLVTSTGAAMAEPAPEPGKGPAIQPATGLAGQPAAVQALDELDADKRRTAAADVCILLQKKHGVWRPQPLGFNWKIPTEEFLRAEVSHVARSDQSEDLAIANMAAYCMGMLKGPAWRSSPTRQEDPLEAAAIHAARASRDPVVRAILLVGLAASPTEAARDAVVAGVDDPHAGVQMAAFYLVERCTYRYFGQMGVIQTGSSAGDIRQAAASIRQAYALDKTFLSVAADRLKARMAAGEYLAKRLGMEVGVDFENIAGKTLRVDFGKLALAWEIFDANGTRVEPARVRKAEPGPLAYPIEPGLQVDRILGTSQENRDGRLVIGVYEWQLKPGRYSIQCNLPLQWNTVDGPAEQITWKGKIDLPAHGFEVIGEVGDEQLLAAVKKVRDAHPAGGLAMWKAMAGLVRPGMIVRQMKLALPARAPVFKDGVLYYYESETWNGNLARMTYWLDDRYGVEAEGFGDWLTSPASGAAATLPAEGAGKPDMVLGAAPRIVLMPQPGSSTASQPAGASAATRPAGTPAERGRQRAAADIQADKARILYYGKPWSADKPMIDDATGLPVEIVTGCAVTEDFVAETNAYNDAIRQWTKNARADILAALKATDEAASAADPNCPGKWGTAANGLQAGLRIKPPAAGDGDKVRLLLAIRNVSDKPIDVFSVATWVGFSGAGGPLAVKVGQQTPAFRGSAIEKAQTLGTRDYVRLAPGQEDTMEFLMTPSHWGLKKVGDGQDAPLNPMLMFIFGNAAKEMPTGIFDGTISLWTGLALSPWVRLDGWKLPARGATQPTDANEPKL